MNAPISLSPELQAQLEREAQARGMSLPDFVRQSLERAIAQQPARDSMFADTAVYRDAGPVDLSAKHDNYLYGDAS